MLIFLMLIGNLVIYETIDVQYKINRLPPPTKLRNTMIILTVLNAIILTFTSILAVVYDSMAWYIVIVLYLATAFIAQLIATLIGTIQITLIVRKFGIKTKTSNS